MTEGNLIFFNKTKGFVFIALINDNDDIFLQSSGLK